MVERLRTGRKNTLIRIRKMIILGIQQFQDPYYQGVAAQLAFFMFLSILPTFILLSQVLGFFSLSLSNIEQWVDINVTGAGVDTIRRMLNYSPSGINSFFLALFLGNASSIAESNSSMPSPFNALIITALPRVGKP